MAGLDVFVVHAFLMATAWLVLMPAGVFVARFFKVTPGQDYPRLVENLFWWNWHRILQYGGLGVALIGVVYAYRGLGGWELAGLHARLGLGAMALGLLQVVSTWFRGTKGGPTEAGADPGDPATWRGDHYDMTRRRRLFEAWHRPMGFVAIGLAFVAALLGLQLLDAPPAVRAMPIVLFAAYAILFAVFTRRGLAVPTCAALWGPDRTRPGTPYSRR